MTRRLCYDHAFLQEFDAQVLSCEPPGIRNVVEGEGIRRARARS